MNPPHRRVVAVAFFIGFVGLLSSGCLGEDYKSLNLVIHDSNRGQTAVIEPEEELEVVLWDDPAHSEAVWTLVWSDPDVIMFTESFYDPYPQGNPAELPEEERRGVPEDQDGLRVFVFTGAAIGETALAFELLSNGESVDTAEIVVAVVEEACDAEAGLMAPRCGGG